MLVPDPGRKKMIAPGLHVSRFSRMKSSRALHRCIATSAVAALTLFGALDGADAASTRARRDEPSQSRGQGAPLLAVVSLNDQRVTIYDSEGKILQSPVSSGATGYETPAGIYSVVQKKEVHASNVYEDGNMPFMQRITWTGIALHAGVLPGQPASHGCVRLPHAFAQQLFPLTDIGLRVIVVRDDILPTAIDHPKLFKPNPARQELALATPAPDRSSGSDRGPAIRLGASTARDVPPSPGSARHVQILKSIAEAKSADAAAATKKAADARQAAMRKAAEAAPASRTLQGAQANLAKAEEQLKAAERTLAERSAAPTETPENPKQAELARQAELAKEKAVARVAETQAQLETAKSQAQAKMEAAARSGDEAKTAEAARDAAVEAAEEANRRTSPVSVFISRKTQRLYIRQGYLPVFEGPVTIRDADKPIGSFVFTALGYLNNGADVRWSVVSMYQYADGERVVQPARKKSDGRTSDALPADVTAAKAALDRIVIPQEALERISEVVLPGSSLIISDEGASIETGKDTDFVVLMSGEPQGGIKVRKREPRYRDDDFFGGGKGGGGFFSFWN
jgi:hypothetical protein